MDSLRHQRPEVKEEPNLFPNEAAEGILPEIRGAAVVFARLLVGLIVFICAEVFSGASLGMGLWHPWTLLLTYWLYFAHFFLLTTLAIRTGRTSLSSLYLWGVLFGLYDWRFEIMAMMQQIRHLEESFGVWSKHEENCFAAADFVAIELSDVRALDGFGQFVGKVDHAIEVLTLEIEQHCLSPCGMGRGWEWSRLEELSEHLDLRG